MLKPSDRLTHFLLAVIAVGVGPSALANLKPQIANAQLTTDTVNPFSLRQQ